MKNILALAAIVLLSVVTADAACKFDPEAYRSEQRRYIIEKTKITNDEATKFFAIYDDMRTAERALFDKIRRGRKSIPVTEEECRKALTEMDNIELQLKKLQIKYHEKMLMVLPARVVLPCLFHAGQFDRMKLRHAGPQRHGGGRKMQGK